MPVLLVLWGSFAAVSKLLLADAGGLEVLFLMFVSAAASMTVWGIFNGGLRRLVGIGARNAGRLSLHGVFLFSYYFFYILALDLIPSVEASMINYLFPIFIVLFAVPINGEKLTPVKIISAAVCFAGVSIIITGGKFGELKISNMSGGLLALGAAVSWGLFSALGKKNAAEPFVSYFFYIAVGLLLSAAAVFAAGGFSLPRFPVLAGCFWLGLSNIVLAFPIWFSVLKKSAASSAANLSFFTPFVTLLFIAALTDEKITAAAVIGVLVIVLGNAAEPAISAVMKRRSKKTK